ncbi:MULTISPECIES: plasmid replication protein, CyRepA1 family [unclassified Coleofasciculus]|uniref:plasmid replication protein, CyRepA1 family n=1 Tax=unclassified Coleofasciculus TaxID=2692782 RepID=UPI0018806546|nr:MULTISPECIES: plasmid replication protein, CyRepA1 family [unclassified Coleofasciculus]MBE9124746.1 DUF3854 domain-containing protein [Coleofasciculus sp. LEGE 07081]MBE9148198.1 DUF3854 domain-containing protein [Coleofasciculus sp. LEGE 07092]
MKRPDYICSDHWNEWRESQVDADIIALNVRSNVDPYSFLCYGLPKSERRNDGRLRDKWIYLYGNLTENWAVRGIDVLNLQSESEWGSIKPDHPRIDTSKNKPIKYEHPARVSTEIFALRVPQHIWQEIASRCGVPLPSPIEAIHFWQWVIENKDVPLILTEGAKKGGAILTVGYACLALPGIFNGYRQQKDAFGFPTGKTHLIEQLQVFATPGRKIYFAFDNDSKPSTRASVKTAIAKTAWLFTQKGCHCYVIDWEGYPEKGVDELIAAHGASTFHHQFNEAKSLHRWQAIQYRQLTYPISFHHDPTQKYLSNFTAPSNAKLICLKAPKGTGKTEWLVRQVLNAIYSGQKVLVISHRRQLARALCERFGIDYLEDVRTSDTQGVFGYGLCVDSMHAQSLAKFKPEQWENALIIIDECEQVFWHLLNASTEVKRHRVEILKNLKTLVTNALSPETEGKVFLSDADLSDYSIDYVISLAGIKVQPWLALHTCTQESDCYDCYVFGGNNPTDLVKALCNHIEAGGKPMVCLSSQKAKSKWSTLVLEAQLQQLFPDKRILRIDAESVSDPLHPAYGSIASLNEILLNYDIVLASPAIETGVSIDIRGHFTSVWGIGLGVQPENSFRQFLSRLREAVPRFIWLASRGIGKIGNGSTSVKSLLASQHSSVAAHLQLLLTCELPEDINTNFQPISLTTWARFAARINQGMNAYKESVLEGLIEEGHRIIPTDSDQNLLPSSVQPLHQQIKATRDQLYQQYCQDVTQAPNPDDNDYQQLASKRSRTQQERIAYHKGQLVRRYGLEEFSPSLVEFDDDGWYAKIRLHYFLTMGKPYLESRDLAVAQRYIQQGEGALWTPDFAYSQWGAAVRVLEFLGILELLDPTLEVSSVSPTIVELAQKALQISWLIECILGLRISEKDTPIAIVQKLLGKCDLKLEYLGRYGSTLERVRVYGGVLVKDNRFDIFQQWSQRDSLAAQHQAATREFHSGEADTVATTKATASPDPETVSTPLNIYIYKDKGGMDMNTPPGEATPHPTPGAPIPAQPVEVRGNSGRSPSEDLVFCHLFLADLQTGAEAFSSAQEVLERFCEAESRGELVIAALPRDYWEQVCGLLPQVLEVLEATEHELPQNDPSPFRLKGAARLLLEAISYGVQTVRCVLKRLSVEERWIALFQLEEQCGDAFAHLEQVDPLFWEWVGTLEPVVE